MTSTHRTRSTVVLSDDRVTNGAARRRFTVPRSVGPLLLYLLIGVGILWPYRTSKFRPAGDLTNVMALSIEAERAWREGQFPIRVGPDMQNHQGYAVFQYYGNFPYSVMGGMTAFLGIDPYTGWKLMTLASFLAAGYFTMRFSLWLCGNFRASVVAGAVFLCAPYLMTDIHARGAFAEMLAFNLMPAAFYSTARTISSRRWNYICWCAISWTIIGLTHNITYLYGATFGALFFLPFPFFGKVVRRFGRLLLAAIAHALMILWYVLPQFRTIPLLNLHSASNPFGSANLTLLRILLAPVLTNTPEGASTPTLGLQVGWPILAGVLLALIGFFRFGQRRLRWVSHLWLVLCFAAAFFGVWSPVDFWVHVPSVYYFIQFTYRMLVFVVVFGSALTAIGLARVFPRRVPNWAWVLALAGAGLAVSSYVPRGHSVIPDFVNSLYANPMNEGLTEYLPSADVMRKTSVSDADPKTVHWADHLAQLDEHPPGPGRRPRIGLPLKLVQYGGKIRCDYTATEPVWLDLPVLDYPGMLDVQDNHRRVPYFNSGLYVSIPVAAGGHHITVKFVGVRWANVVSLIAVLAVIGVLGFSAVRHWLILHPILKHKKPAEHRPPSRGFGFPEALAGASLLLAAAVVPNLHLVQRLFDHRPKLLHVSASQSIAAPENAFDDDPFTVWESNGNRPAWLSATFARSATMHGLVLDARITTLYEAYEHVGVKVFDHGTLKYEGEFDLPLQYTRARETIEFPPVRGDTIQLNFSHPVLRSTDGSSIHTDAVNPGYSEIKVLWD